MKKLFIALTALALTLTSMAQVILDELNGSTLGTATGITYITTPNGQGAVFSRSAESRIEYPFSMGLPHEGTIEMAIKVTSGYSYNNNVLTENHSDAIIFNTGNIDVNYLGAMWLNVDNAGGISLTTALSSTPTTHTLSATGTTFRFNEWHIVSFSYGSQGQFLKVDDVLVTSNASYTETLQTCGDFGNNRDVPTVGEIKSVFWANNRYDNGFEGVLDRFRISNIQKDWSLTPCSVSPCADIPAAAGQISGSATTTQGQNSVSYYIPPIDKATGYVWTLPSGVSIVNGFNTNSITVNFSNATISGNISVYGTNCCGSGTVSPNFAVAVLSSTGFSTISGKIFNDINNNGIYDVGIDFPQSTGWTVQIQGIVNKSITPNLDGTYSFSNLPTGTYTVSEIVPSDWTIISPFIKGSYIIDLSNGGKKINKDFANLYLVRKNSNLEILSFPNGLQTGNNAGIPSSPGSPFQSLPMSVENLPVNVIHLKVTSNSIVPKTFYVQKDQLVMLAVSNANTSISAEIFRFYDTKLSGIAMGLATGETKMIIFKTYNVLYGEVLNFYSDIFDHASQGATGSMIIKDYVPPTPTITITGNVLHSDAVNGNQWFNKNGMITGATSQDYTVVYNDEYYCIVTLMGSSSNKSNTITISSLLNNIETLKSTFSLFPNPMLDELTIETSIQNKPMNFEIFNLMGQIVYSGKVAGKTVVQTNNLPTGVYIVKLENSKLFEYTKIVKK